MARPHARKLGGKTSAGKTGASEATPSRLPAAFAAGIQVAPGHYGSRYEHATRWVNYGTQVREVMARAPRTILEVGLGAGTVAAILRSRGLSVTTFDFDPEVRPDLVGSVQELARHVPPKSFDLVLCAEVLEHLPFALLPACGEQLAAVAREHVLIGLPCFLKPRWGARLELHLPRLGVREWSFGAGPLPRWRATDPEHYWEVDYRPYSLVRVLEAIGGALRVTEVVRESRDPGHLILSCSPRGKGTVRE